MTQPMERDPINDIPGNSEMSWGRGIFPPGVANNEGQQKWQDDFGAVLPGAITGRDTNRDIHAKAVADRRTDPTDPASTRDFTVPGLVDRYGPNPPLVQADPEPNVWDGEVIVPNKSERRW